jgi:glycosyltransferase involved in cell wall biosynthesis
MRCRRPVDVGMMSTMHSDVSKPEISVVIPTRNRRELLSRTLACALGQRDVRHEVVVVDDGSTDDTAKMLATIDDRRLRRVHHEVASGVATARNKGIAEARGEWIAFLDDDDLWAPDKLASQLHEARELGRRWAYTGSVAISSATLEVITGFPPRSPEEAAKWLPWRNTVLGGASSVIARRDLLEEAGGFDTGLRHMADWDLWIRLAKYGGIPAVVPRPLLGYVQHPGNASFDTASIPAELSLVEARYADLRDGSPADRAYVYRWMAWNSIRSGRRSMALRCYWRAAVEGDVGSIARLVVTALHPSIAGWVRRRQLPPAEWRLAAEGWLRALPA